MTLTAPISQRQARNMCALARYGNLGTIALAATGALPTPEPETRNPNYMYPKPLNLKPETRNPKPETRNPETLNLKP